MISFETLLRNGVSRLSVIHYLEEIFYSRKSLNKLGSLKYRITTTKFGESIVEIVHIIYLGGEKHHRNLLILIECNRIKFM